MLEKTTCLQPNHAANRNRVTLGEIAGLLARGLPHRQARGIVAITPADLACYRLLEAVAAPSTTTR